MGFSEKLTAAITNNQTLLTGNLDANLELLGGRAGTTANFRDYLGRLIEQTQDLVCAYRLGFGFYEALGIEGFTLLNWVRQAVPAELPLILDVKHGDLNSSTVFARTIFQDWGVDAVTLSPYAGWDHAAAFLMYGDRGVFVLCRTSNPGAAMIQEFPDSQNPHYLQVVAEARNWGSPEQLYLEAGTTDIAAITKIRHLAPERTILLRSIWQEEVDLPALLGASWDAQAGGVLLPVPQEFLFQGNLRSRPNRRFKLHRYLHPSGSPSH
ncbi:MAG: orotidine 5'-phosphate decarboxylase / HUMPS family protein [Cyanobacteria bacterium P01_H01_bin.15]